jgi:hypothetical protein
MGIENRIHKHYLNSISGLETKLYFSIRKHGIHNFKYECIDESDSFNEIKNKEIYWIEKYDSFKNGYNMTKGGDGGDIINQLTDEKYDIFVSKMSKINGGSGNPKYSGYTDDEIVDFAIEFYKENNFNWIRKKWHNNYCDRFNIPKSFSKFRFNGKGLKEMKRQMVIKLNNMGHDIKEIKYKKTNEHKEKLSELNKNKYWYHNDTLKENKQLKLSELSKGWERGIKKYN